MTNGRGLTRALGVLAVGLVTAGITVFLVPLVLLIAATSADRVSVTEGPTEVEAPAGRTWGIYFDDANNSGYSEACIVEDSGGDPIDLRLPGMSITSSDTETLDYEFTTPSDGVFVVDCDPRGATVRVGPKGDFEQVLLGAGGACVLGLAAVVSGSFWLNRRTPVPTAFAAG